MATAVAAANFHKRNPFSFSYYIMFDGFLFYDVQQPQGRPCCHPPPRLSFSPILTMMEIK